MSQPGLSETKGARRVAWLLLFLMAAPGACDKDGADSKSGGGKAQLLPIEITDSAKLLYTYKAGDGFKTANGIEEVPPGARGWVRVLNPREARGSTGYVYVADLCKKGDKGRYRYQVVPLETFESKGPRGCGTAAALGATKGTPGSGRGVTIYMTTTCPVCTKAMSFMKKRGIPFVAKDINKDPAAARELAKKAAAAGVQVRGVPIFDVGGKLLRGFDPRALLSALGQGD